MKLSQIISSAVLLATLSSAGPLRRDRIPRLNARSVQFANTTQTPISSSTTSTSEILTIIPIATSAQKTSSTSTGLSSSSLSSSSSSSSSHTATPSTSLAVQVTSPTSTPSSSSTSSSSSSAQTSTESSSGFSSPATNSSTSTPGAAAADAGIAPSTTPTLTKNGTAATSSRSGATETSIPFFTLNNTSIIIPPTSGIVEPSSLAASAGFQTESPSAPNPTVQITIDVSSLLTSHTSTHSSAPVASSAPSETFTRAPTIISSTPPASGTISPSDYSANLAEAQGYNNLFSTLNFSSPCTDKEIACISGSVGVCNSAGNYVITTVCPSGQQCFAMPMNTTVGVSVGCTNTAEAESVLGLSGTSSIPPAPKSTSSIPTLPNSISTSSSRVFASQTTIAVGGSSSIPPAPKSASTPTLPNSISTSSSRVFVSQTTIAVGGSITSPIISIASTRTPAPAPVQATSSTHPTGTFTVTVYPGTSTVIIPAPSAPAPSPKPKATSLANTIIPVSIYTGPPTKETVTVTDFITVAKLTVTEKATVTQGP